MPQGCRIRCWTFLLALAALIAAAPVRAQDSQYWDIQ
jgi:hypothetical protein